MQTEQRIRRLLQINVDDGIGENIGVPLSGKPLNKEAFNYIEEKVTARISSWQWRALSLAGRANLLRSLLTSIPLYTLSSIHVPNIILNKIEREYTAFLWGHTS